MRPWRVFLIAVISAAFLVADCSALASGAPEEHFLDFSVDNYKVSFISGNLTAAVTYAWPKIVFQHSTDPFSATFEVGMPTMYLFNDTNGDGLFVRPEAVYMAYIDSFHGAIWNVSGVTFYNDTVGGEVALYTMSAPVALFSNVSDVEPSVSDWANITFWFEISEKAMTYSNSFGSYTVQGGTELRFNYTLDIRKEVNCTGLALEHLLKGGGSASMFLIRESSWRPGAHLTPVYSREDETLNGPDFTHKLSQTTLPCQEINFAKDDNTVQAFYHYSSEPIANVSGGLRPVEMNSSFYTTGTGMMLNVAYTMTNETTMLVHEGVIGIDEAGFAVRVRDWLEDNIVAILSVVAGIAAVVSVSVLLTRVWRKKRKPEGAGPTVQEKD